MSSTTGYVRRQGGHADGGGAVGSRDPRAAREPSRRKDRVAKEAQLRARVDLARALGDPAEERTAGRELADILAARDTELDLAVELAFRALASTDDPPLRHALAGWLEGLGEPGLAASELRKLAKVATGHAAASILVRIGVLHARAGDVVGAHEALREAAEMDAADPLPLELLGAVATWAAATYGADGADREVDGSPGPRAGADAYVMAARRRAASGDADRELEDLLRALEVDPTSPLAVAALMSCYAARDRHDAADQVLRTHAVALATRRDTDRSRSADESELEPSAAEVHARRRALALEAGHLGRALGAALDERLDSSFEGPSADLFDDLLARAGVYELLAVRLEVRAERDREGTGERWAELGRLLAGPLAAPSRALECLARAVAADASNAEWVHALRSLAQRNGDLSWLVEGLVRAAMGSAAYGASSNAASRLAAAHELVSLAEERGETRLSAWAYQILSELDPGDERARAARDRLSGDVERHDEELAMARRALEASAADGRVLALAELARLARGVPDASRELASVLLELAEDRGSLGSAEAGPAPYDEELVFAEALRVAERVGDFEGSARLARARLKARGPNVRVRNVLVSALRRQGDMAGASAEARVFAEDAAARWTCSVAWTTAAVANDEVTRGRAMAALAPASGSRVHAMIAAVAAEVLADAGEAELARRAAEQACRADGRNVRALLVLARLTSSADAHLARAAIERAIESSGPSAYWCARLSEILAQAGDVRGAVEWARRRVALRPGEPAAAQTLVDLAVRAGDAEALAEALAWLLPQPQPSKEMGERIAPALEALGALDPERAAGIGRRVLDVLGPRHAPMRRAIEQVAISARDPGLRARLVERWIAAGAPAAERGPRLLELAAHYQELGDLHAELSAYARAAREGMDLSVRAPRLDELAESAKTPEEELAFLEARAKLRVDQGMSSEAAEALRDLGAALWDMADDRPRAVHAWLRAAQCDAARGYDTLRRDLASFADTQYAVDCLSELVARETDRVRSGVIATQAARAALDVGAHTRALGLAKLALERDPGHAEALETAESACVELARVAEMSPIYDQVARRARGRFGRRAAHHRAARFFESGDVAMLALKHSAQAFIAVPSEGSTLALLQRTAAKAQREGVAVRTIEYVAELARSPSARAAWLLRAVGLTPPTLDGARQRMDLLLKATVIAPSPATLELLSSAAREIVSLAPEDVAAVALRLERAGDQLAKSLEGPDGARIAIAFADMALALFSDGEWGWRSLERAIGADADVDEYARITPRAAVLARASGAGDALGRVTAEVEKPYSNVGHALLRLLGAIAGERGDDGRRAELLLRAAEKEPDDDELLVEAETAVREHGDVALAGRLSSKVGAFRRAEALRAVAKKATGRGDITEAVKMLERATEIATAEQQPALAKELGEALLAAGRGEDAILRQLARTDLAKSERAMCWADLTRLRAEHGDLSGAADAALQAATEEPTLARWSAVESAAEAAGREHTRVDALLRLAELTRALEAPGELGGILKRLARAEGARGSLAAAEAAWREVFSIDPDDAEADVAIEALLVARASFDELAEHLGQRAARLERSAVADDKERLRAVRLRRAAILEQRLARLEDACAELERVLREHPGHPSALRWLADLYERAGEPQKSLPLLERLFAGATEELEYITLGVRRVRALLGAGQIKKAQQSVKDLYTRTPAVIAVAEARLEVARASQDPTELGSALEALARVSVEEPRLRSEMLVESAQAAARAGDGETSLRRAREAARLAPDVASTQLFARGLEYRLRGVGSRDDALATVASLERLAADPPGRLAESIAPLEPDDVALRAFLLAEAEDVLHGPGAGEDTLKRCLAQVGAQPLVALGLAERAARGGRHDEAYRFYTEAVYGNLLGLRRPGRVALAAAESASRAGDVAATQRFLNEAAKDPETRGEALVRVARLALAADDVAKARTVFRGLAEDSAGADPAGVLTELARALLSPSDASERLEGERAVREAMTHAAPEVADALRAELERARVGSSSHGHEPLASERVAEAHEMGTAEGRRLSSEIPGLPKIPPAPPAPLAAFEEEPSITSVRHPPLGSARPSASGSGEASAQPQPGSDSPGPRAGEAGASIMEIPTTPAGKVAKARARLLHGPREEAEQLLTEALREGSIEAADLLDDMLKDEPSRRGALLKVRRQAVELHPGNTARLIALRDAARADQNPNYVRAIEHVLHAFGPGAAPSPPPPLTAQSSPPGMLTLLTRHSHEPAGEALGVVWEGAPSVFAKSAAAVGTAGLERVVPGPTSALSRLYEVALRLLDPPRFALLHRRPTNLGRPRRGELAFEEEGVPLQLSVTLSSAPAAVLSGDAREDGLDLRWAVGLALSSVLPQNVLVLGLGQAEARALWGVVLGAFGPPGLVTLDRRDAVLADMLWQTLAPRTQRRLQELLAGADPTPFELVLERAKQSGRRVGMFLTGDFGHAARSIVADFPQANANDLDQPGGLEKLCAELPGLADLLRLAVRPEYADARWHLPTPASQRLASGRLPPM